MNFQRLSLVISQMGVGGAERVLSILANAWSESGVEVQLITIASTERDFYPLHAAIDRVGLDLVRPSPSLISAVQNNFRRVGGVRRALRDFSPQVVLSFAPPANVTTLLATRGTGLPVVVSERNDPTMRGQPFAWRMLRRILYPRAAAVAVQTERVRKWAADNLPGTRCIVIPNPVRPVTSRSPSREDHGPSYIVAMGRLVPQKGFDRLIEAFAQLGEPNWRLMLIGDGPERTALESQTRALGIGDRVDFAGQVNDPDRYLAMGSIFALSSRYEGFPNALLEAMALGIAPVSFDCPSGPSDIIEHGYNGLLVPAADTGRLASALSNLIGDPGLRERLGRAAATSVKEKFSVDSVLQQWNRVLGSAASRKPSNLGRRSGPQQI